MPESVQISDNPPVAADIIDNEAYQRVKVTWGEDDTAHDTDETNPLPVSVKNFGAGVRIAGSSVNADTIPTSGSYVPLATAFVNAQGEVMSVSSPYHTSPVAWTTQSTIYTTNTFLASQVIQFPDAVESILSGWISNMLVYDKSGVKPRIQFFFLNASVSTPTVNTAFNISDSDLEKVVMVIDTDDGVWYEGTDGAVCIIEPGRVKPYSVAASGPLYCVGKVIGTPTLGSTSAISTRLVLLRD